MNLLSHEFLAAALLAIAGAAMSENCQARPYPTIPVQSMRAEPPIAMGSSGLEPPGIMLGHSGKWMVGYEFMFERMSGNLNGTNRVSESEILQRFFAAPTQMNMQMHMGMLMYAPSEKLTLMAMVPYSVKSMDHVTVDGERFNERTSGFGDIELRGHYTLYSQPDLRHRIFLNAGIAVPTGSINQRQNGLRLEYPMQLGSGTVSLMPGISYLGQADGWGWGADFVPTVRVGKNSNDYRLGNQYRLDLWALRQLSDTLNLSVRADARRVENIHGADPELDPNDEQTKDPQLQGGKRLDLLVGLNFLPAGNQHMDGHRFFLEAGAPVYQSLDGPQLKTTFIGRLHWQWHFQ